jgi:hypothetical protein
MRGIRQGDLPMIPCEALFSLLVPAGIERVDFRGSVNKNHYRRRAGATSVEITRQGVAAIGTQKEIGESTSTKVASSGFFARCC